MRLPSTSEERARLFRNLIRQMEHDREERRLRHRRYKKLLITGSEGVYPAIYGKLAEHVENSTSFLYSSSAVRFGVNLPPHFGDEWMDEEEAAGNELHRIWHDTGAGLTFGLGVRWAHADDTSVFKVTAEGGEPRVDLIPDPADVGVMRPDLNEWDRQEAIVHWFALDLPTYARLLAGIPDDRRRADLWTQAQEHATPWMGTNDDALPAPVQSLIISAVSPNMIGAPTGGVLGYPNVSLAIPRSREPMVPMAELWVLDDMDSKDRKGNWHADYRKVWMFCPTEQIILDADNPLVPGEHPFHGLTLNPVPGYLWGICPLEALLGLAQWRERRMGQVDRLMELQLDPPLFFEMFGGAIDEQRKRFWQPGGSIASPMPNAKVTNLAPQMPPEAFAEINEIDRMFAARAGLPLGSQGRTEPGVRSGDQAQVQAILGAGPTLERAMLVEHRCEAIATQMLRLRRRLSGETLRTKEGHEFLLSQVPDEFVARVNAHSASPLFGQMIVQKAVLAMDRKAISAEDFVALLDLPMVEMLQAKARRAAKQGAERAERLVQAKETEAQAKETRAEAQARKT